MRNATKTRRLIEKLKDKIYRDSFVSDHISVGLPFQIKALRQQRKWTQEKLAEKAQMKQAVISRLENNYERFTLSTLRKLASGFDVALLVKFVGFDNRKVYRGDRVKVTHPD